MNARTLWSAAACAVAMLALGNAAPARDGAAPTTQALQYVGTRHRSSSGDSRETDQVVYDDRYAVTDAVRIDGPAGRRVRTDDLDFTPAGTPGEPAPPEVERRVRYERAQTRDGRTALAVIAETTTYDAPTIFPRYLTLGVSADESTTTTYDAPRIVAALDGSRSTIVNSVARIVAVRGARSGRLTTRFKAGGSIERRGAGHFDAMETFSQAPGGTAHDVTTAMGAYAYDLRADAPLATAAGRTIHVAVRRSSDAADAPVFVTDGSVPDWYPGGIPGPGIDTIRTLGRVTLPVACEHPLGRTAGFGSDERRVQTLATGSVEIATTHAFTDGDAILCTIEDVDRQTFDPSTGALVARSDDDLTLHLSRVGVEQRSVALYATNRPSDGYDIDRHGTGAPVLALATNENGAAAMRFLPASIAQPHVAITVAPPLAEATIGEGGGIFVRAGGTAGSATLTARLTGPGGASASLPIAIYRGVAVGCASGQSKAIAFAPDGRAHDVADASLADIAVGGPGGFGSCSPTTDSRVLTFAFPFGAVVLHTTHDDGAFTRLAPSMWKHATDTIDGRSVLAQAIVRPYVSVGNLPYIESIERTYGDDGQDLLLVKTRTGAIVKILCRRSGRFAIAGPYALANGSRFER